MYRTFIQVLFLILVYSDSVSGQIFRYKIGGNVSNFRKELKPLEVIYPLVNVMSSPLSTDFKSNPGIGIEGELIRPWTSNLETGFEFGYDTFSGENEFPPYYNYYFAADVPYIDAEPIAFHTSSIDLLANFKYFFAVEKKLNPFVKIYAGSSLISTELNYKNLQITQDQEKVVLYSAGTSGSSNPKKAVFHYGAGAGLNYNITDKLAFYLAYNMSVINSGLINGIPNYNYSLENNQPFFSISDTKSLVTQVGFGLVFTTIKLEFNKAPKKKSGGHKKSKGHTSTYYPFYKEK